HRLVEPELDLGQVAALRGAVEGLPISAVWHRVLLFVDRFVHGSPTPPRGGPRRTPQTCEISLLEEVVPRPSTRVTRPLPEGRGRGPGSAAGRPATRPASACLERRALPEAERRDMDGRCRSCPRSRRRAKTSSGGRRGGAWYGSSGA